MKVVWFSNISIGRTKNDGSGSWLIAMKDIICTDVELINITESNVNEIEYSSYEDISEYVLPMYKLKKGIPSKKNINKIKDIIENIKPDIIHIWGIEKYWGLLFSRDFLNGNTILEIQGLRTSCFNVYYAGIQSYTLLKYKSFKEFVRPTKYLPHFLKREILKKSYFENEMITYFKRISTQSQWTRDQIQFRIPPDVVIFNTRRPIRNFFYSCDKWQQKECNKYVIFTSLSYNVPFKGLHILLKAVTILKKQIPDIILKIAGVDLFKIPLYRRSSYDNYLISLISHNQLKCNVKFLGRLDDKQIAKELLESNVFVNTSFVESYSASSAEALTIGVPSVLSFSGALPEFSKDNKTALLFSPLDFVSCASKIKQVLIDENLQRELSENSILEMKTKNNNEQIKNLQLSIYNNVLLTE